MFTRYSTRVLAAVAVLSLLGTLVGFGYVLGRTASPGSNSDFSLLHEIQRQIETSAVDQPDEQALTEGAARGMLRGLEDPYSSYMTPEAYRVFGEELLTGRYSGVGIWLNRDEQVVKIVAVVPGGPADDAGVVPGDQVQSVDGAEVAELSLDEVAQNILGESGTEVTLGLLVGGEELKELTLVREKIELPSLESSMEGDAGVLQLLSFTGGVGSKVVEAIDDLEAQGAKGLVLDMRGNPGGSLVEAVDVASAFFDDGLIVSYQERGQEEKVFNATSQPGTDLPLVVLVDQGSASASEIVAAAVQDRERGPVVGTETYGKGSVQQVFELSDGSAVKLTVATYHTPSGRVIGQEGVEPDVRVEDRDQQLPRAIEVLNEMIDGGAQVAAAS
ncbi:MAG: S41 family peptidase [Actinomycetota bacterium]